MNILESLRKPYYALLLSSLILFISCEQYINKSNQRNFDYTLYKEFSKLNFNPNDILNKSNTFIMSERMRLDNINEEFNTNINFSNEFLLLREKHPSEIEETALLNGWLNEVDIYLMDEFISDLKNSDFNTALVNFENNVIDLNLNETEFNNKVITANALRALHDENPAIFEQRVDSWPDWACIRATLALIVSSVGLAACATIILCGLAVTAWILSYATYIDACMD